MTDVHPRRCKCPGCKLGRVHQEAARSRKRMQVARQNTRVFLNWWLAERLQNPADFDTFIGLDEVSLPDGAIDFVELERRVKLLVEEHPYLAAM